MDLNLVDYIKSIFPLLLERKVSRMDGKIEEEDYIYRVTAYRAGTIIRVDIQPDKKEGQEDK